MTKCKTNLREMNKLVSFQRKSVRHFLNKMNHNSGNLSAGEDKTDGKTSASVLLVVYYCGIV